MRKLINGEQALCLNCQTSLAIMVADGSIRCHRCGRMMLVDKKSKELFVPEFGEDDFYQASVYTPKLKSRRNNEKQFPIIRDRRKPQIFNHKRMSGE